MRWMMMTMVMMMLAELFSTMCTSVFEPSHSGK